MARASRKQPDRCFPHASTIERRRKTKICPDIAIRLHGPSLASFLRMKRLHRLFVAFTIFNLLTISAALYIEHHVTRDYTVSLAASERFMDRIAAYNTLEELAGNV